MEKQNPCNSDSYFIIESLPPRAHTEVNAVAFASPYRIIERQSFGKILKLSYPPTRALCLKTT